MADRDDAISVDDHFARFGKKSYAINKINSVEVRETAKQGSKAYILWWPLALLLAFSAKASIDAGASDSALVFGLIVIFLAYIGWRSFQKRHNTSLFHLFLMTSSSETQALTTPNESLVDKLRDDIEKAMTRH